LRSEEIIKKYSRYELEMKMMEENEKTLAPHVAKINQIVERKNKNYLRMYKYQILDAQRETTGLNN
jgi:hypothetical protein